MNVRAGRDDTERLQDIVDAAASIEGHLKALDDGVAPEEIAMDAIKYNLVAIGEAATHISDDTQKENSDVDWAGIKGLRNVLTHEYFRVNHHLIRTIAEKNVPVLADRAAEILDAQ